MLRRLLEAGYEPRRGVLFVDWVTWADQVQAGYGSERSSRLIRQAIAADVLLLDDLWRGKITHDLLRIFFMVLNGRGRRPTAVTMNGDPCEGGLLRLMQNEALRFALARLPNREELEGTLRDQIFDDADAIDSRLNAFVRVQMWGEDARAPRLVAS